MTDRTDTYKSSDLVRIVLDGNSVEVERGTTILAAATSAGIPIPTLCHYGGLDPAGACRVCVVEVAISGSKKLVPSCSHKIDQPMEVETRSDRVLRSRKLTLELLLARCPESEVVRDLAREYGIETPRFEKDNDDCILCGLCVRVCRELMGVEALSMVGRGWSRKVSPPYDKHSPVCMSCGACAFVCPTNRINISDIYAGTVEGNPSQFDEKLIQRGNVYLSYPQQIPKVPVIDPENCVKLKTGECGACERICAVGAIDYSQKDREEELEVGAVIMTPGYDLYDATQKGALGFGRYPNVLTNLQFERLLNASGPTGGEIIRPSDGTHPEKIAFIQCTGSRDTNEEGKPYCSTICCMASIKEAVIAREHDRNVKPTIFYIDMRTHGKNFERYFEDARNKHGVTFRRSSVAKVYQKPSTNNLMLRFADEESGQILEEEFHMVVLAAGLVAKDSNTALAEGLNITLNGHGFCEGHVHQLLSKIKGGVFAGGAFTEPKYIPEAVVEGSSAASAAARLLAGARGTRSRKKKYPKQIDVSKQMPRIGVFVCRCGRNIASTVNVPEVAEYASRLPRVVYSGEFIYSCSQDSLEEIKAKIKEKRLNRVVVASCTPTTHQYLFADTIREAGLNRYYFELASIREHVSWVHMNEPEKATNKAKEIVEMMVEKIRGARPVRLKYSPVTPAGLVVGGGISGMNAALSLSDQGFDSIIVEKEDRLGGHYLEHALPVSDLFPDDYVQTLVDDVTGRQNIRVLLGSEIISFSGVLGDFKATVRNSVSGEETEVSCGAVIVAVGAEERATHEYGYGTDERIMTQSEFEDKFLSPGTPSVPGSVVMIQCVGSREDPNMYCSRTCCTHAVQNAIRIKETSPASEVYILYRDIRTYGFREELYRQAREMGVVFLRYTRERKPAVEAKNGQLDIHVFDNISRREMALSADCLVLSTGMAPRPEHEKLSQVLRVPLNGDGFFLEAHAKIRPVDFTSEGLFMAGLAHSPRFTNECISQALAASSRAATILSKDKIECKAEIVEVNAARCSGCGICVSTCPYDAREIDDETGKAVVLEILCQGCGSCAVACPNGATDQNLFSQRQILRMLEPVGRADTAETHEGNE